MASSIMYQWTSSHGQVRIWQAARIGLKKLLIALCRKSKQYMLLAGLWCSTQKPPSFSFLEPLFESMKRIEEEGEPGFIIISSCSSKRGKGLLLGLKFTMIILDFPWFSSVIPVCPCIHYFLFHAPVLFSPPCLTLHASIIYSWCLFTRYWSSYCW